MSEHTKKPSKRERLEMAAWGIHPGIGKDMIFQGLDGEGGFSFRSPSSVWFWVTAVPALSMAIFIAASVLGFTIWTPALFVAAGFGLAGMVSMTIAYRAFLLRGWGQAIMDIEHAKRKEHHYGK